MGTLGVEGTVGVEGVAGTVGVAGVAGAVGATGVSGVVGTVGTAGTFAFTFALLDVGNAGTSWLMNSVPASMGDSGAGPVATSATGTAAAF